ncbi:MAG TPA: YkuS family protein [Limnochordales bacterium]
MPQGSWLVACDDELSRTFRPHLEAAGFRVVSLHDAPLPQVDAVVLSRLDSNLLGDTRRLTPAVVVDAARMTPQEVVSMLRERLGS